MALYDKEQALAYSKGSRQTLLIEEMVAGPVTINSAMIGFTRVSSVGKCACDLRSFRNLRKRMSAGGFTFTKDGNNISMDYDPRKARV